MAKGKHRRRNCWHFWREGAWSSWTNGACIPCWLARDSRRRVWG